MSYCRIGTILHVSDVMNFPRINNCKELENQSGNKDEFPVRNAGGTDNC